MNSGAGLAGQDELVSKILHDFAQPVTSLECGLELSLLQDKTVGEFQIRLRKLLGIAQGLHVRMLELRAARDAGESGQSWQQAHARLDAKRDADLA